ncbi:PREDICTED: retinol dehydrogenase 11-like isoform X1 [Amphimedon queenslandica]|uniref:Uncharacterized protein n=1 Tax=Amphimedon queenslandica TaxID=400682 RepID=A0A1X7V821_AMPQE|nr:PREDICTED: retinol dehydrogenase 11-like isoform X1 [Amphimedon queenslandica]|eukprot:XP_019850137.1 PREDICTED: retinol dehydrogenase 11-like isoform X1 [Amphimedon queenslandica]
MEFLNFGCCNLSTLLICSGVAVLGLAAFRYFAVIGRSCTSKRRLDGKVAIVTGANTGIGKETALDLAKRGARVILACRDEKKGREAVSYVKEGSGSENVVLKKLDLASLASIRTFSSEILDEEDRIDILINNAGVMLTPYCLTEDGFEMQFGTNHLGHFLLTNLLLDKIKESAPSRIVTVSSVGHYFGSLDFNDMMWSKHYGSQKSYFRSKLANVMFARELGKRLEGTGVTTYSLHPGSINTELGRHLVAGWKAIFKPILYPISWLLAKTPTQGAQTTLHCAVSEEAEGITGKYWSNCSIAKPNKLALIDEDCKKLWEYSEQQVNL